MTSALTNRLSQANPGHTPHTPLSEVLTPLHAPLWKVLTARYLMTAELALP